MVMGILTEIISLYGVKAVVVVTMAVVVVLTVVVFPMSLLITEVVVGSDD